LAAAFLSCVLPACAPSTRRKQAPDFALRDQNNRVLRLSDYYGQVVLLDFWATWCVPCRVEMPWFEDLARQYRGRGLIVLGVSMDEKGWTAVLPFLEEHRVGYPVVLGTEQVFQAYGLGPPPTTLLIDRHGAIAAVHAGLVKRNVFSEAVENLLRDPAR
jgi:cytochrome c biogenesis protein CcmG/thiol:disulfide interchange protein DsbE